MVKKTLALSILCAFSIHAFADDKCDPALQPTSEAINADYKINQAYMYEHASDAYDNSKKLQSEGKNLSASVMKYSAEYNESNNKEEFHDKVRKKLIKEGFTMNGSDAQQYYRRNLTTEQLTNWRECIAIKSAKGGLLLSAKDIAEDSFTLQATWAITAGAGADLELDVTGGKINNKTKLSEHFVGSGSQVYTVIKMKNAKKIRVGGNMASLSDSVLVPLELAPVPNPVPDKDQTKCLYKPEGAFYDFDGDGCHDKWETNFRSLTINSGSGGSFQILPSAPYNGDIGVWLVGDFNGDRKTDLAQIVTAGVDRPDYAHIFCNIYSASDYKLRDFNFKNNAKDKKNSYCVSCGKWTAEDLNNDGVSDLKHVAPDGTYKWISVTGAPPDNETKVEICGHFDKR